MRNITVGNVEKLLQIDVNGQLIIKPTELLNSHNPCVVISMIGTARVGKSTFINAFLSHLLNANISIVKTASSSTHCTLGIDLIKCTCSTPTYNFDLIILDCQGLMYEDSKSDDKLLAIIYLLSGIVVYHDAGIINNQTLNTLTPLCLVMDHIKNIELEKKPILFFRMRDYNLDSEPADIINTTFTKRDDQYDKVRGAIQHLFPQIKTICTEPIGKKDLNLLKNNEYLKVIDDSGFSDSFEILITHIMELIVQSNESNESNKSNELNESNELNKLNKLNESSNNIYAKLSNIVRNINQNEKITWENYDYYTLLIEKRFSEFYKNIPKYLFESIEPDYLELTFQTSVDKLEQIYELIENFKSIFSNVESTLIIDQINKFNIELIKPIEQVQLNIFQLAEDYIDSNDYIGKMCNYFLFELYKDQTVIFAKFQSKLSEEQIKIKWNEIIDNSICKKMLDKTFNYVKSMYFNKIYPSYLNIYDIHLNNLTNIKNRMFSIGSIQCTNIQSNINLIEDFTIDKNKHFANIIFQTISKCSNFFKNNWILHQIKQLDITRTNCKIITIEQFFTDCAIKTKQNLEEELLEPIIKEIKSMLDNYLYENSNLIDQMYLENFQFKYKNKFIANDIISIQKEFDFGSITIISNYSSSTDLAQILNWICEQNSITTGKFIVNSNGIIGTFLRGDSNQLIQSICNCTNISVNKFSNIFGCSINSNDFNTNIIKFSIDTVGNIFGQVFANKLVSYYMCANE